jgi:hypothetical protein
MNSGGGSRHFFSLVFAVAAVLIIMFAPGCRAGQQGDTETIVMIRHGEKPPGGLGQLDCKGLNRALALPDVLLRRFGKPDFLYASNPSAQVNDGGVPYSYVRPLATIEPTAIREGLPVNTQIGYNRIDELQKALTQPAYAHALIFVAWEHKYLYDFAQQFLKSYGDDPSVIPPWPAGDYDAIYVFTLTRQNGKTHLSFRPEQEGLNGSLSDACPGVSSR